MAGIYMHNFIFKQLQNEAINFFTELGFSNLFSPVVRFSCPEECDGNCYWFANESM